MPTAGVNTSVATPLAFSVPVPSVAVPLRKVTVPVGAAPLAAATVAVKVSVWPTFNVVGFAVSVVVVTIAFTVTAIGGDETEARSS